MRNCHIQCLRSYWILGRYCALILAWFSAGCASKRDQISQALAGSANVVAFREISPEETYRLGYQDAVEIIVNGLPELSGRFTINVEGRIEIPYLDNLRVDGETIPGLQRKIAQELKLPCEKIICRVVAHRSRLIYVRGPIEAGDRAVPYQGPENVVNFIRRCGGLLPSANVKDIHVVRSNVSRGTRPQVFTVDLEAIMLKGDPKTNVFLQSFDEVYIGEMPRAKLGRALPKWLRPVYRGCCDLFPCLCPHDWRQQIREPSH